MSLNKCCLGDYLELLEEKNTDLKYGIESVRGVNNLKKMMPTKADLNGRDLSKFQIVNPGEFFFNHRTSRNGSKFSITYNDESDPIICTEDYVVFRIKPECEQILLADWLYMYFNREEFDRYVITNSWGSSTEFYNWEDICSIVLELPSPRVQEMFVDVYRALLANQQNYEHGIEDLRTVLEGYIDNLRRDYPHESIGDYIELSEERNDKLDYDLESVRGISIEKKLIETKADMTGVSLSPYYVLKPNYFVYVPVTSRNGGKISLAINDTDESYICSSSYIVFRCKDENKLLPQYLMLYFSRSEFNRYARFNSWGSAREIFDWSEMLNVKIPVPEINTQRAIANIYSCYIDRKAISEKINARIKDICPILVKGSIEEARREA